MKLGWYGGCPRRRRSLWQRLMGERPDHRVEVVAARRGYIAAFGYAVRLRCLDCLAEHDTFWGDADFLENDLVPPSWKAATR
jgi:hypothetical protein